MLDLSGSAWFLPVNHWLSPSYVCMQIKFVPYASDRGEQLCISGKSILCSWHIAPLSWDIGSPKMTTYFSTFNFISLCKMAKFIYFGGSPFSVWTLPLFRRTLCVCIHMGRFYCSLSDGELHFRGHLQKVLFQFHLPPIWCDLSLVCHDLG